MKTHSDGAMILSRLDRIHIWPYFLYGVNWADHRFFINVGRKYDGAYVALVNA